MNSEPNEKVLVSGCINNDRKSQEILYRTYFTSMYNMCRYYTQDDDRAKEILNIGFLRVFQKIQLYRFEGTLESWIRKLIYHVCMRELTKKMNCIVWSRSQTVNNKVMTTHWKKCSTLKFWN